MPKHSQTLARISFPGASFGNPARAPAIIAPQVRTQVGAVRLRSILAPAERVAPTLVLKKCSVFV